MSRTFRISIALAVSAFIKVPFPQTLSGKVVDAAAQPLPGARVTLFNADTSFFREVRTDAAGIYSIADVPSGAYRAGASALDREYQEKAIAMPAASALDFILGPETEPGKWDIILSEAPDRLGGTNSAAMLPDGRIMYCHNTLDPFAFNPANGQVSRPIASPRQQGCHAVALTPDGLLIYVGGHETGVYGPGTKQVKTYDPVADKWLVRSDLNGYRWYPSMVPLPDGGLLAVGGGNENNPQRSKTSEIMDPATFQWTPAGDIAIGNEVSPIVLLLTGKALMTHRPPQLFDPESKTWRKAGDFVQSNRMANGDHADHDMVLLPDGRAVAIGYMGFTPGAPGNLVEIYDPAKDEWRLGANFAPVRSRPNVTLLPGNKILSMGGKKEERGTAPGDTNAWGQLKLTDLYDPARDTWRRLAELNVAREYHATPVLAADGRVIIVGGEGQPGNEPAKSTLEGFRPPYLFRGIRPEIRNLARTSATRGGTIDFEVAQTNAPTSVILMSLSANTHFMDSGNNRYLELSFEAIAGKVRASVPSDPNRVPLGYYMLMAMIDDVPSPAKIIRIEAGTSGIRNFTMNREGAAPRPGKTGRWNGRDFHRFWDFLGRAAR